MAIYDNLPVFKLLYDLLLELFELSRNLQRDYKFTIGEKLRIELLDILVCVYRANSTTDKSAPLRLAREHMVVIKLYVRILHDLKQISIKRYASLSDKIEIISKQLTAWNKSIESKNRERPESG